MAKSVRTGGSLTIRSTDLPRLAKALRKATPEVHSAMKKSLLAVGKIISDDAKSRAAQSGIPSNIAASVKLSVLSSGRIKVTAGGSKAPTAKTLEFDGKIRHPVFGHTDRWAEQPGHAFLFPALAAHQEEVAILIADELSRIIDRLPNGGE